MSGGRLPKRIVFGNLEGAVRRGRGGKEKEWTDYVQSDIRAFGIAGDWKATALKAEVWVETVTEGGRRFMAAWRKEEVDAAKHRQEKREATRLGTVLSQTGVLLLIVVDSHIQRIVLASEETTVTQQVSHRPIKCQSRLWSQRGTRVNGSHHGDNPLLRPTGIQIATKSYAALQAMAPTNIKTVHQTSILHIESNLDRLGMLSPTHDQRSQQKTGKITLQPVLINKSKILKATHCTEIRTNEIPRSMVVEALSWRSRRASQHPAVQSPVHP